MLEIDISSITQSPMECENKANKEHSNYNSIAQLSYMTRQGSSVKLHEHRSSTDRCIHICNTMFFFRISSLKALSNIKSVFFLVGYDNRVRCKIRRAYSRIILMLVPQ